MKSVRVLAGPTGPTGTFQGVRIFPNITGPTGQYPQWAQLNEQQAGTGPTGANGPFEHVYPIGATAYAQAPTGTFKTVIISGYTGPA